MDGREEPCVVWVGSCGLQIPVVEDGSGVRGVEGVDIRVGEDFFSLQLYLSDVVGIEVLEGRGLPHSIVYSCAGGVDPCG